MKDVIVGIGEILWDVLPGGKVLGGAPANFAYHLSQFGLNGYAVSAIGNDTNGNEIVELLNEKQLRTHIEVVDFPTGTVQVTLSGNGIPNYEICEGVAWDNIPFTEELRSLAQRTRTVCFGSLAQRSAVSHATINRFLEEVPDGAMKIFDINLRQSFYSREIIEISLQKCTVLKINDDEIKLVAAMFGWDSTSEIEVARKLMKDYELTIVVLTRGTEGSYVFTAANTSYLPTPCVEVADTVGAGDSFTAAFVASLLKGKSTIEAHQKAVEVSAYVCTQRGAMPVLPASLVSD